MSLQIHLCVPKQQWDRCNGRKEHICKDEADKTSFKWPVSERLNTLGNGINCLRVTRDIVSLLYSSTCSGQKIIKRDSNPFLYFHKLIIRKCVPMLNYWKKNVHVTNRYCNGVLVWIKELKVKQRQDLDAWASKTIPSGANNSSMRGGREPANQTPGWVFHRASGSSLFPSRSVINAPCILSHLMTSSRTRSCHLGNLLWLSPFIFQISLKLPGPIVIQEATASK